MRRTILGVLAALGVGAIGMLPASADSSGYSTWCTDGSPTGETSILGSPVSLSFETGPGQVPAYVMACYSTTPSPGSDPEAAGGRIYVSNPLVANGLHMECGADRGPQTVVAIDCYNAATIADDPNFIGTSVFATFQESALPPIDVGRTGVEGNEPTVGTNLPAPVGSADGLTGASVDMHLCVWATGPGLCPAPADVGVAVSDGDVAAAPQNGTPPCTGFNNTCPGATVRVGQHPSDTVVVTAVDTTQRANVPDLGCFQVNATC